MRSAISAAAIHGARANLEFNGSLIESLNRLLDRNAAQAPRTELLCLIDELRMGLFDRFRSHEAHLIRIGHPGLEGHITAHARLMHEFEKHANAFELSAPTLSQAFLAFLSDWLNSYLKQSTLSAAGAWTSVQA
jgi:hemerythrin